MKTIATSTAMEGFISAVQEFTVGTPLENAYILSVATLFATILVAYLVKMFFKVVIQQVLSRSKADVDDEVAKTVGNALFVAIVFAGLTIFLLSFVSSFEFQVVIVKTMSTVVLTYWTFSLIRIIKVVFTFLSRLERAPLVKRETVPLFHNASALIIFILAVYAVLSLVWGVNLTALVASLGVAGIAIGFAAKDTLANLFSGVFILADQPYKIGDYIVLGSGERGEVTSIGIRSTRIMTREDVEITIPNSIMGNTSIVNESGGPHKKMRITANVGVAYGTDIDKVRDLLLEIADNNPDVEAEPKPRVRMRGFGASSLDFALLTWAREPADRGKTLDALYTEIYKRLQAEGIEIPYQKHDVFIKEMPDK